MAEQPTLNADAERLNKICKDAIMLYYDMTCLFMMRLEKARFLVNSPSSLDLPLVKNALADFRVLMTEIERLSKALVEYAERGYNELYQR